MTEGRGGGGEDPTMTHVLILEGNPTPPQSLSVSLLTNKYDACVFKLLKLVKTTMCLIGNIETPQAALLPF